MDRFLDRCCRGLEFALAAGLGLMVVLVFGNVVLRYGFNSGIAVSEELSRWLFIWITFLGAVIAVRERAHLGTGFLLDRLGPAGQKFCLAAGHALSILTCVLVLQGAWTQMMINADVTAPSSGASMGIFYASGVVFAGCAIVLLGWDLWRLVTGRVAAHALATLRESEEEPA